MMLLKVFSYLLSNFAQFLRNRFDIIYWFRTTYDKSSHKLHIKFA